MPTYYIDLSAGTNGTGTALDPFNTFSGIDLTVDDTTIWIRRTGSSYTSTLTTSLNHGNKLHLIGWPMPGDIYYDERDTSLTAWDADTEDYWHITVADEFWLNNPSATELYVARLHLTTGSAIIRASGLYVGHQGVVYRSLFDHDPTATNIRYPCIGGYAPSIVASRGNYGVSGGLWVSNYCVMPTIIDYEYALTDGLGDSSISVTGADVSTTKYGVFHANVSVLSGTATHTPKPVFISGTLASDNISNSLIYATDSPHIAELVSQQGQHSTIIIQAPKISIPASTDLTGNKLYIKTSEIDTLDVSSADKLQINPITSATSIALLDPAPVGSTVGKYWYGLVNPKPSHSATSIAGYDGNKAWYKEHNNVTATESSVLHNGNNTIHITTNSTSSTLALSIDEHMIIKEQVPVSGANTIRIYGATQLAAGHILEECVWVAIVVLWFDIDGYKIELSSTIEEDDEIWVGDSNLTTWHIDVPITLAVPSEIYVKASVSLSNIPGTYTYIDPNPDVNI